MIGQSAMEAINQIIGSRRVRLLHRVTRPIRVGSLFIKEGNQNAWPAVTGQSLIGPEYTLSYAREDELPRTMVQIEGAYESIEVAVAGETDGLRFELVHAPDIYTRDGLRREAETIVRETREHAELAQVSLPPNLRIENEDLVSSQATGDWRTWIVDSMSIEYQMDDEEVFVEQTLGLRIYPGLLEYSGRPSLLGALEPEGGEEPAWNRFTDESGNYLTDEVGQLLGGY
jgi:hypothetical protein